MLVIISDIHLTDGESGETVGEPAFRAFRQRLRDLVYDASWRGPKRDEHGKIVMVPKKRKGRIVRDENGETVLIPDDQYTPIKEMHILLLGDILDVIRSPTWLDKELPNGLPTAARPWGDNAKSSVITPQSPDFIGRVKAINDGILKENADSFELLRRLTDGKAGEPVEPLGSSKFKGLLKLTKKGGKYPGAEEQQVKVHIHYMVGNHDWFYHLPGDAYNEIRKSVVDAIGLANDPNEPFPHDPDEDTESARAIRKVLQDHKVFARHGDKYDPSNYEKEHGRDASSMGDAIVVELLGRFPEEVENAANPEHKSFNPKLKSLSKDVLHDFKELDNVKPYEVIPGWINGVLERAGLEENVSNEIKKIWNGVADDFLKLPFVRAHDKPWRIDMVDKMQLVLKLAEGASLRKIGDLLLQVFQWRGTKPLSYHKSALTEKAFIDGSAEFIVYGHTHDHEVVPLAVRRQDDGSILRQLYINSGTWRRVHKIGREDPGNLEFYDWNVMTYLAFFKDKERDGQRFETWSAARGVDRSPKA